MKLNILNHPLISDRLVLLICSCFLFLIEFSVIYFPVMASYPLHMQLVKSKGYNPRLQQAQLQVLVQFYLKQTLLYICPKILIHTGYFFFFFLTIKDGLNFKLVVEEANFFHLVPRLLLPIVHNFFFF